MLFLPAREGAPLAGEGPLLSVGAHVAPQLVLPRQHLAAYLARGRGAALLTAVLVGHVLSQVTLRGEQDAALSALHLFGRRRRYFAPLDQ